MRFHDRIFGSLQEAYLQIWILNRDNFRLKYILLNSIEMTKFLTEVLMPRPSLERLVILSKLWVLEILIYI
jgi:hypothetical protein